MKWFWLTILIALFAMEATSQSYTDLQEGQIYPANSRVQIATLGIKFQVPQGWKGALPQGSSYFVMDSDDGLATTFLMVDNWTGDQLLQLMSQYIALDEVSGLTPAGQVRNTGGKYLCQYTVNGSMPPLHAYAVGKPGDHGYSVAAVILSAPENLESKKESIVNFMDSFILTAPDQVAVAAQSGGITDWKEYMTGRYIVYMKTESGYSEEEKIWLCTDGSFARYHSDSYMSGGDFSYAGEVPEKYGKWDVMGNTLFLNYEDGTQGQYTLAIYEDSLYLNDRKWFRDTNERCQ
jgi:hypothetical protein